MIFEIGKKKSCCQSFTSEMVKDMQNGGIKVLGGGCLKCHELQENAQRALIQLGMDDEVELITDFSIIASYGILSTPALLIDQTIVSVGKVIKTDAIVDELKRVRG